MHTVSGIVSQDACYQSTGNDSKDKRHYIPPLPSGICFKGYFLLFIINNMLYYHANQCKSFRMFELTMLQLAII